MALKQDDRALLQLICERSQSYEDIAGLLGTSSEDVRSKARAALAELGGADPDAEVGLTDYLLGQADPIGRADAVRYLQQDDGARELAAEICAKLGMIAPGASLPKLPEPRNKRRRAAAPSRAEIEATAPAAGDRGAPLSGTGGVPTMGQSRMIAAIAGLGVILVFVILAVAGVFSGSDSTSPSSTTTAQQADSQSPVTEVSLKAAGGSGVAGKANFGIASGTTLYIDLSLNGLKPTPAKGSAYWLWLMLSPDSGYPVTIVQPDKNGSITDRYSIPPVLNELAGRAIAVQIGENSTQKLGQLAKAAANSNSPVVAFEGKQLAVGQIPKATPSDTGTAPPATGTPPPASGTAPPATTTTPGTTTPPPTTTTP